MFFRVQAGLDGEDKFPLKIGQLQVSKYRPRIEKSLPNLLKPGSEFSLSQANRPGKIAFLAMQDNDRDLLLFVLALFGVFIHTISSGFDKPEYTIYGIPLRLLRKRPSMTNKRPLELNV